MINRCPICLIPHAHHRKCGDVIRERAAKIRAGWSEETEYERRAVKQTQVDYGRTSRISDGD